MAVFKGISLTKCTLAVATVFLVLLSLELSQVDAAGCDSNSIMSQMSSCMGLKAEPAPGSTCCNAMNYVKNTIQPDDSCICNIAKNPSLSGVGLDASKIKDVIETCVGASAVPACLN